MLLERRWSKKGEEAPLSYYSWINETSEYHLSRTLSIRFLGGKKSWKDRKSDKKLYQLFLVVLQSLSTERFTLAITRLFYVPSGANEEPFASEPTFSIRLVSSMHTSEITVVVKGVIGLFNF